MSGIGVSYKILPKQQKRIKAMNEIWIRFYDAQNELWIEPLKQLYKTQEPSQYFINDKQVRKGTFEDVERKLCEIIHNDLTKHIIDSKV